ncbi:MAG: TolC family protein [Bacteroidetes bacterium]|nr:TolC family protein [Bacteroidota bacterium]
MFRLSYLFLLSLFFFTVSATAQENVKLLSLDEAIKTSLNNNKSVQIATIEKEISAAGYKQTNAIFLPQVNFSYTAISTNNPLNAFGFKLEQKSISAADFNPDLLNHPDGTPDFTTKLEVQQPLVNMDMIYMRKAAAAQTEIYSHKLERTKEYITFEVSKAYLQLQLAYDAVNVMEDALKTVNAVYKFTDDHFQQGLIQKSDVLNVQVQVASVESNLQKAKSNIKNASDYISLLMGEPTGIIYKAVPAEGNEIIISVTDTSYIPASRADFLAMSKAIEAKNLVIQSNKMSMLPKLNAFGSYQYNDNRMFGFGANAYLAGIQLSWDIFKGNRTRNIISTQTLERNKLRSELEQQKAQSNLELNKTKQDIIDAQFEISQYRKAVEQSSEALRILQNRYTQGLVNTTDVMMAATQLSQQKLALAQAFFNQHVSNAYLQFLTATENK